MPFFDASSDGGCETGCGSGQCPDGEGVSYNNESVSVHFGVGKLDSETTAGHLFIHVEDPTADLYTPELLEVVTDPSIDTAGTHIIRSSGVLRQVWTTQRLVDIITNAEDSGVAVDSYELRYYMEDQIEVAQVSGLWVPKTAEDPYKTIVISKPTGVTAGHNVRITEKDDNGDAMRVSEYFWDDTDDFWTLAEGLDKTTPTLGSALRRESFEEDIDGDTRTETRKILSGDGTTTLSHVEEIYTQYPFGWVMTERTVDPSGAELAETWDYYTAPGEDGYGNLKSYTSETGYWEHYVYDADGVLGKTVMQFEDNAYDGSDVATLESDNVVMEYSEASGTIPGGTEDVFVRITTIKAEGTVERVSYQVYRGTTAVTDTHEVWSIACATTNPELGNGTLNFVKHMLAGTDDGGDLYASAGHLVSKTWTYDGGHVDEYKTARRLSPDGQVTVYDYSGNDVVVIERGYADNPLAASPTMEYGTRTTTKTDAIGNSASSLAERVSQDANGGNYFTVSYTETITTDAFGRPTQTDYFFGAEAEDAKDGSGGTKAYSTSRTYGGCCGSAGEYTMTNRQGVETIYYYDDLGRVYRTVVAPLTEGEIATARNFDALGRAVDRGIDDMDPELTDTFDRSDAGDHVSSVAYDTAGRMTSSTDPEGRKTHTTYRRVKADGTAFTLGTDTGVFYWETRRYGHNDDVPVGVSWTDSRGRTVLSFIGSCTWSGTPSGTESLTEEAGRSMSVYDWAGRVTESRVYFDLSGLSISLSSVGTEGTNYLVTGKTEYDELGRGYRRTDAAGNITEAVYENGTGRMVATKAGVTVGSLSVVSRQFYKLFGGSDPANAPSGDDRPWVTRSYSVKPELTAAPVENADMDDYVYVETYEAFEVTANALVNSHRGAVPQHGPWSKSTSNAQGQTVYQRTYKNDSTTYILSQSEQTYITAATHNGLPEYSYAHEVDGSGAVTGDYLRTTYFYDDASRQVKVQADGRGFTKTEFDDYGRTARTVFCSEEGSNTTVYGANAFTDDIVLSESVPTYDKSGLVLYSTSYSRNHSDATTTGLLSAAASSVSRVSYSATWYDDNGRPTHGATYGTYDFAAFSRPASPPEWDDPGISDNYLVSKIEYDDAGRSYITTDNSGKKSRVFYDDMGRTTHTIENWDGTLDTPDTPGSRDADENRVTAYIYDNSATGGGARIQLIAIDPDNDGVYTGSGGNQVTEYIHSGELNVAKRGPIPVNGRPVTTLMPDAIEDGTSRASAIAAIDSGGGGDFTLTEFYANGQPYKMTDARGVEWTYEYTDEGWLDHRRVTDTGSPAVEGDLRFSYHYGDAGEVTKILTYSAAAGGSTVTSRIDYVYDGFYNQVEEWQNHDPDPDPAAAKDDIDGNPRIVTRHFDDTATGNVFDHAYRPTGVTYPNGREIDLVYGTSGEIDDNIGRVAGLDDSTPGSVLGDYEITRYSYLGSGAMVRKDYTVPDLRLDFVDESGEGSSSTDPYDASFDRFGRALRYQWETYDPGTDAADASRIEIAHAYDRASNRLYDQRTVYPGHSKVFAHDDLDRIDDVETGEHNGNASSPAIESFWKLEDQGWALDALGNPLEASDLNNPNMFETDVNDANEVTERRFDTGGRLRSEDDFSSDSSADWDKPGSNDVMAISGGIMKFTTVAQDTSGSGIDDPTAQAIAFLGETIGPAQIQTSIKFPSGATTGEAGIVFGYKSPTDYWLRVMNIGDQQIHVYKVEDQGGTVVRVLKASRGWNITAGTLEVYPTNARGNSLIYPTYLDLDSEGGYPAGKIGLYSTVADAEFDYVRWNPTERHYNGRGRWSSYTQAGFNGADDRLNVIANAQSNWTPVLLDHLTAKNFEATFRFTRTATPHSFSSVRLVFNATSIDDYDSIQVRLDTAGSAVAPLGTECVDGLQDVSVTQTRVPSNVPLAPGGEMWARVISDGTELKVFCALTESGLDTAVTNDTYAYVSSDFDMVGGQIGVCAAGGFTALNDFKLKMDLNDDGDFTDTGETQLIEDFVDAGGFGELEPEYDAAGNLTFDGTRKFTYDAQNRLIKVQYAYLSTSPGATLAEYRYDALGRRIEEKAYLGGELDNVSHHYYLGWSVIETRNGSDQVVTQHVWENLAGHYIDSLAEVTHNLNPGFDEDSVTSGTQDYCETRLFAMQDQQFNVMGLTTANGTIVERYEYTLYGKRQVYRAAGEDIGAILNADIDNDGEVDSDDNNILAFNFGNTVTAGDRAKGDLNGDGTVNSLDLGTLAGSIDGPGDGNDPLCHAPALTSAKMPFSAAPLCSIGFQGLRHDETTGLIDNRARVYAPILQRFLQRDPLGYPDGMNTYAPYHVMRGGLDPSGLWERDDWSGGSAGPYAGTATAECGDTLEQLAEAITGKGEDATLLRLNGEEEVGPILEGQVVDITPLLDTLENRLRSNTVRAASLIKDNPNILFPNWEDDRTDNDDYINPHNMDIPEIMTFFDHRGGGYCDCTGAVTISMQRSLLDTLSVERVEAMDYIPYFPIESREVLAQDALIGDWGKIENHPTYPLLHPLGGYSRENVIKVGENEWWGYPTGTRSLEWWNDTLILYYNSGIPEESRITEIPGISRIFQFINVSQVGMDMFDSYHK